MAIHEVRVRSLQALLDFVRVSTTFLPAVMGSLSERNILFMVFSESSRFLLLQDYQPYPFLPLFNKPRLFFP